MPQLLLLLCHMCRAFSPLEGFMSEQQYLSVVQNMRLPVRLACSSHPFLKFACLVGYEERKD